MRKPQLSLSKAFAVWWHRQHEDTGTLKSFCRLLAIFYEFLRDSLPDRRRQRYGDMDYDWEHRVNTTGATLSWQTRLLGLLHSVYQPIPPQQFREIMSTLSAHLAPEANFSQFTFIDIGAGKGRALLLASEFGFRRIIGIELLPELVQVALENVRDFEHRGMRSGIEVICNDAANFAFPAGPAVVFLFNPLPQSSFRMFLENLEKWLHQNSDPVYVVYANPIFEQTIGAVRSLIRLGGTDQCLLFRSSGG
ncbi:MAG: class I SAM-dependent methyltransferase [Terriglobales bacterium]